MAEQNPSLKHPTDMNAPGLQQEYSTLGLDVRGITS